MENAEVNTTICPASSLSEFICWAIVNEEIAVGADNIIISEANSTFLNPRKMLIGKNIAGIRISFPHTPSIIGLICPFIAEKLKDPPRIISDRGVAILEISPMVLCKNSGILIFKISIINPITEAIMRGFVKTPLIMCFIFILPPLKISSIMTDNTLNIGTITAINKDVTQIFLSPNSEIVTGIPNITKLLRKIPCINAPLVLLSFSILGIIKTKSKKIEKILIIATAISLRLREPFKSVLYILKNNSNGRKDLKQTLFILFKVCSSNKLNFFRTYPSDIVRNKGRTTFIDRIKFSKVYSP